MTAKDQSKILKAGFTIIRKRDFERGAKPKRFEIFQKTPERREWHSLDWNFASENARQIRILDLLMDPKIVED